MSLYFLLVWMVLTAQSPSASQELSSAIQTGLETESEPLPPEEVSAAQPANAERAPQGDTTTGPATGNSDTTSNVGHDYLTTREKFSVFGRRMISPTGFAKSAFTASINQAQNSPEEWGQGVEGFAKRYGHKITNRAVENGIGFLVSVPLRQDPRYFYSNETGLWRRARHALMHTVLTPTDSGGRTFAAWRFAGNYGAQVVSNAWRPERYRTVSDTLLRGTISIGYDAASNFFKEIWPDIKRTVFRH